MTNIFKLSAAVLALGLTVAGCADSGAFPGPSDDQIGNSSYDGPMPLGLSAPSE